ncbi:methane monooxygenase/ammonia monooxygenase, subunit B [Nitrosococcus halophilus Nc 4]|uniref:Methane monooxygenase/ammonia monooxygenase, subunit B n=2 Tax=Nitrosococcus halophilus TaxID=133539 RepID=D5BWX6_NITHN|nr:methane monooxygenase/ammonia monooxygenase, subunit B [Nitrosococcus halophilus Nc 4]
MKGNIMNRARKWLAIGFATVVASSVFYVPTVAAHGEKSQAAFLRMRTIHWYDLRWSKDQIAVNETYTMSGKFRVFSDWPEAVRHPHVSFLNVGQPGPVSTRMSSYINDVFVPRSVGIELGGDYSFSVELKGRRPGTWHVHTMMNIEGGGPLIGPGKYITITGNIEDFENPITDLTGNTVDIERLGLGTIVGWHVFWYVLGIAWMWWWARRPMFLPRYMRVEAGEANDLVTDTDKKVTLGVMVGVLVIVLYGYESAEGKHPVTVPLQAGLLGDIDPLPVNYDAMVSVDVLKANYRVPGRTITMKLEVTNHTDEVISIGEFATGGIRFLNPDVIVDDTDYPDNLLAPEGLEVSQQDIAPGETVVVEVAGTDAAWEVERMADVIYDPDSRFGGLLFFVDPEGNRMPIPVGGPLVPIFV